MTMPAQLRMSRYLLGIHLVVFSALVLKAVDDGRVLQLWWVIHPVVCFSLIFHFRGMNNRQAIFLFLYFIALPVILFYKISLFIHDYGVDIISLTLASVLIITPMAAAPLIWLNRHYFQANPVKTSNA